MGQEQAMGQGGLLGWTVNDHISESSLVTSKSKPFVLTKPRWYILEVH
jgi:hypothetical protein